MVYTSILSTTFSLRGTLRDINPKYLSTTLFPWKVQRLFLRRGPAARRFRSHFRHRTPTGVKLAPTLTPPVRKQNSFRIWRFRKSDVIGFPCTPSLVSPLSCRSGNLLHSMSRVLFLSYTSCLTRGTNTINGSFFDFLLRQSELCHSRHAGHAIDVRLLKGGGKLELLGDTSTFTRHRRWLLPHTHRGGRASGPALLNPVPSFVTSKQIHTYPK